jgi:hypothetical protein
MSTTSRKTTLEVIDLAHIHCAHSWFSYIVVSNNVLARKNSKSDMSDTEIEKALEQVAVGECITHHESNLNQNWIKVSNSEWALQA